MALFPDPFDTLSSLQQALDSFRSSSWLAAGPSGGGTYPPMNVFRKGDDLVIIAEVPGVKKSDLDVQVKGNTIRLAGTKPSFLLSITIKPLKCLERHADIGLKRSHVI